MQLSLAVGVGSELTTLKDYLAERGKRVAATELADVGKAATALYRRRFRCAPAKIDDGEWGRVNAYPIDLAEEILRLFEYL